MKKMIVSVVLFVFLVSVVSALETGLVIEFEDSDDVFYDCMNVEDGSNVREMLEEFDSKDNDIDMDIPGSAWGHYLSGINGVKEKQDGDKSYGWNFFVNSGSGYYVPEISPGWGAGIDDYEVQEGDVVGVKYSYAIYGPPPTYELLRKAEEPLGYSIDSLCNNPFVEIEVKVDSDREGSADENGGDIDVMPGSNVEFEIDVENLFPDDSEIDIDGIYIELDLDDIEDDLILWIGEFDLGADKDKKVELEFKVPENIDADEYEIVLTIEAEDSNDIEYDEEIKFILDVSKENHDIRIDELILSKEGVCKGSEVGLTISVINTGEKDEEIIIGIMNEELGIDVKHDAGTLEGDRDDSIASFEFNLNAEKEGSFPISVKVVYNGGKDEVNDHVNLVVKDCDGEEEIEEKVIVKEQKKEIEQEEEIEEESEEEIKEQEKEYEIDLLMLMPIFAGGLMVFLVLGGVIVAAVVRKG